MTNAMLSPMQLHDHEENLADVKILILDNSYTVGFLSSKLIERLGYTAKVVKDGTDLLASVEEFQPNIIIIDIKVKGGENGIELAAACKEKYDLPIIFITAFLDRNTLELATQVAPESVILKPADISTFEAHISVALHNCLSKKELQHAQEMRIAEMHDKVAEKIAEIEDTKIQMEELSMTNKHLVSATWRERDDKKELKEEQKLKLAEMETLISQKTKQIMMTEMHNEELSTTNQHLISATWRERDMKNELQSTVNELTLSKTIIKEQQTTMDDLNSSKSIIEKQNRKISESMNYAKRIQDTLFPDESRLRNHLRQSLLYSRPKDVVSGDFPWIYRTGDNLILAAVDCTGHGVPGALMSVVGNSLMRQIVGKTPDTQAGNMLDLLHVMLRRSLNRNAGRGVNDGMDVALCIINLKTWTLNYAGAHRPLLLCRDGVVERIGGDRLAIGGYHSSTDQRFSNSFVQLKPGDFFAIFTDGYPNQFGGPENRKMGVKRMEELIRNVAVEPEADRKSMVQGFYENWIGEQKQIDDVLFIGAKVPDKIG
jgi:serine phosphatase RsbU (regulator of sigma subunit)/CheY-like chemotaxis protein